MHDENKGKIVDLTGNPIMNTPPSEIPEEEVTRPKQVPLNEVIGFVSLKFSTLGEAAGMLNLMASGKGKNSKRRNVTKWETIPTMNKVSGQVEYTMLVEVK